MSTEQPRPSRPVRRAVVLGGAGFIGSHLVRALREEGCEVLVVDNHCTSPRPLAPWLDPRTILTDDVSSLAGLWVPAVRRFRPDVIFHLASPASPPRYRALARETMWANALGARHAIDLCRTTGARLVYTSTSEVYGDPAVSPQSESYRGSVSTDGPRSVYDEAKRFTEALIAAERAVVPTRPDEKPLDAAVLRLFNTYGPGMDLHDGRVVPTFIRQALTGQNLTVHGSGGQTRSLCYVSDTVAALLAAASSPWRTEVPINVGNDDERTVLEIASLVASLTESGSRVAHTQADADDPQRRCPALSRARALLHWSPSVRVEDGLARTVKHYLSLEPETYRAAAETPAPARP